MLPAKGFTVIEILVSLSLLALLSLTLLATVVSVLSMSRSHYVATLAINQLDNLYDRLQLLGNTVNLPAQVHAWNEDNQQQLAGFGAVSGTFPYYTVSLYWGKADISACSSLTPQGGCLRVSFMV